jgi:hypothetical protein
LGAKVTLSVFAAGFNDPGLFDLFQHFLRGQGLVKKHRNHCVNPKVALVNSVTSIYFAPSDRRGTAGHREIIRATPSWRNSSPRYDTVFVRTGLVPGPHGLSVAQIRALFFFCINDTRHNVALVEWFSYIGNSPDEDTGMWMVEREKQDAGLPLMDFIFAEAILRSCHLLPVYGEEMISGNISQEISLDIFQKFYVNKFADRHCFELLS